MEYTVALVQSEEGFSVSCSTLRGCHSQGSTKEEALGNIKSALRQCQEAHADKDSALSFPERIVTE